MQQNGAEESVLCSSLTMALLWYAACDMLRRNRKESHDYAALCDVTCVRAYCFLVWRKWSFKYVEES